MLKQLKSPKGICLYVREDGSFLQREGSILPRLLFLDNKNKRGRFSLDKFKQPTAGSGGWENRRGNLWCHLMPYELVEWSDEE